MSTHRRLDIAILLTATLAGCSRREPTHTVSPPVTVRTARVSVQAMPDDVTAVGTSEASSTVDVRAQVTGTLRAIHFAEGADVQAGQLLFTIDPGPFEAALAAAQGTLARDAATLDNATSEQARYEALARDLVVATEQLEAARTAARTAAAAVAADRANVTAARLQLDKTRIQAPVAGRTGHVPVDVGDLIDAESPTAMVSIAQIAPMHVSLAVPGAMLDRIREALRTDTVRADAAVDGTGTVATDGRIVFLDNAIDPATGTIRVKVAYPNRDGRLWPGQFVSVVLHLGLAERAIVVPTEAVQQGQAGDYVFVVGVDHTVEARPVRTIATGGGLTRVSSGLRDGELVVTDGQVRLAAGMRVVP
ncbi:RND transporter [Luteitalea sp. TBR-22]|uniref:efflux RND transporter periplasmic adaptor subunit n=1 Tax=Luteitalea sp. TBR-22 TaxID=2802971 RepID=UPI001AFACACB|nr:efflux RND transporter periplasmic adaptor subunit [Luteitalea sp. TBR-22]BCS35044.1 RND transporter [Luteitalea sp. TBR-22]